jgi:hypothetical protein
MVGVVVAGVLGLEWSAVRGDVVTLAVVGMSATLGGVVGGAGDGHPDCF